MGVDRPGDRLDHPRRRRPSEASTHERARAGIGFTCPGPRDLPPTSPREHPDGLFARPDGVRRIPILVPALSHLRTSSTARRRPLGGQRSSSWRSPALADPRSCFSTNPAGHFGLHRRGDREHHPRDQQDTASPSCSIEQNVEFARRLRPFVIVGDVAASAPGTSPGWSTPRSDLPHPTPTTRPRRPRARSRRTSKPRKTGRPSCFTETSFHRRHRRCRRRRTTSPPRITRGRDHRQLPQDRRRSGHQSRVFGPRPDRLPDIPATASCTATRRCARTPPPFPATETDIFAETCRKAKVWGDVLADAASATRRTYQTRRYSTLILMNDKGEIVRSTARSCPGCRSRNGIPATTCHRGEISRSR